MSRHQLALGPLGLPAKKVSAPAESHGNPLAVDLCELVVAAFTRSGYNRQQAAGLLEMSPSSFTRAFSDSDVYADQNVAMKRLGHAPAGVLKEFAALLAERVGLSAGIDSAKVQASVDFAEATLRLLKVAER